MKTFLCVVALALAGCSTTSGLQPTSSMSGFDGARVVNIAPHGAACTGLPCVSIGAQWSAANPTMALMQVSYYGGIVGLTDAKLSVDGRFIETVPERNLTNFGNLGDPIKASSRSFVVPLAALREVASAKRAWIRVGTTTGYVDEAIVDGERDSKALHALRRFLAEVDNGAGWDKLNPPQK